MNGDLMRGSEVMALLGISKKTLQRYRDDDWNEGIHYFKPKQQCYYNRPLIEDWIRNHGSDPAAHQRAMEAWLKASQTQKRSRG
jgi:Putative excisionase (DUF1233)/Helix-turn-helix domain